MGLSGTFSTMPFPDLVHWLGESRATGTLTVILEFEERYIGLSDGRITSVGSDDARARDVARLALGQQLIDEEQLRSAIQKSTRENRPIRDVLIGDGFVAADRLESALRASVKHSLFSLFFWHEGRFVFSDDAQPSLWSEQHGPDHRTTIDPPIPAREILMEGIQRLDEWQRMAELLPTDYTLVHALGRSEELPILDELATAGEPLALGDLCLRMPVSRFEVMEQLYKAYQRGLIGVDKAPKRIVEGVDGGPIEMLVQTAETMLDARQFDEAASLLRSVLDLDPYHETARAYLGRARSEQLEELYQQFPPHKVPIARTQAQTPARTASLSQREQFLLSRIDGKRDLAILTIVTPLSELETLRAIKKLHHAGLLEFVSGAQTTR